MPIYMGHFNTGVGSGTAMSRARSAGIARQRTIKHLRHLEMVDIVVDVPQELQEKDEINLVWDDPSNDTG